MLNKLKIGESISSEESDAAGVTILPEERGLVVQRDWNNVSGAPVLSQMKLGDTIIFGAKESTEDFLTLAKKYIENSSKALAGKVLFDKLKKEKGDFEKLENALTQQQFYDNLAKTQLEAAWKALKKDKVMQGMIRIRSKAELQEKLSDMKFKKLLDGISTTETSKPTHIPLLSAVIL